MRIKRERKDAVSPVIAVILMVAITVVLAGVLYVWVTSLSTNEEDMVVAYRLSARDSEFNLPAKGDTFQVDDILVRVEHSGGGPIDWNGHTVYLEKQNSSERIEIALDSIAGQPFDAATNSKSEVGNYLEFKATTTEFTSGEWIKFIVIQGSNQRYKSPGYMPIY
jgi:flagellin-like protein